MPDFSIGLARECRNWGWTFDEFRARHSGTKLGTPEPADSAPDVAGSLMPLTLLRQNQCANDAPLIRSSGRRPLLSPSNAQLMFARSFVARTPRRQTLAHFIRGGSGRLFLRRRRGVEVKSATSLRACIPIVTSVFPITTIAAGDLGETVDDLDCPDVLGRATAARKATSFSLNDARRLI